MGSSSAFRPYLVSALNAWGEGSRWIIIEQWATNQEVRWDTN